MKLKLDVEILLPILFLLLVFLFRFFLTQHTDIWSDELAWASFGSGTLIENLKHLIQEPTPNAPFEVILWEFSSKPLLRLGLEPNLGFRLTQLLFSCLTSLLPFFSKLITTREKNLWLAWSGLSCAITAMAFNGRPYSGMIFFSSCALFAGVVMRRMSLTGTKDRSLFLYLTLLIPGPIHQAYVAFPAFCLLLFSLSSKMSARLKAQVSALLCLPLGLFALWFLILRHSTPLPTLSTEAVWHAMSGAPWKDIAGQVLGTLSNPGKRMLVALPLALLGLWRVWKQDGKLTAYLATALAMGIVLPIYLDFKHQYFFVPRQTLAALPFWGWLFCSGMITILESKWRVWAQRLAVYGLFVWTGGVPNINLIKNVPPYIDQPRRQYQTVITDHVGPKQGIITLSWCEENLIRLYAQASRSKQPISIFQPATLQAADLGPQVKAWSTLPSATCGGPPHERSTDPALESEVIQNPKAWVVITSEESLIPRALKNVECWNATDRKCLRLH